MAAMTGSESPLATPSATRRILEEHGLAAKHALGQNFLVSDAIVRKIVQLSGIADTDCVLEVGPGIGTLTIPLLKHAGSVISVERDKDLPAVLAQTCAPWADHFTLLGKDALALEAADFADTLPTRFIANLPYAVAATLVLDYFERFESIKSATVMVQKEVADRIMAQAGSKDYGAYTVKLGMYAKPAGRFAVGAGNFFPPPRVESAVVRLDRSVPCDGEGKPLSSRLVELACRMADAAFATRRKTISNSFKTYLSAAPASVAGLAGRTDELFERAGIDSRRRGETLIHEEFVSLGLAAAELLGMQEDAGCA